MKVKNIYLYDNKIMHGTIKRKDMQMPTTRDIKETKNLFKDFNIKEDIPGFKTRNELYNWRNRVIRGALNE